MQQQRQDRARERAERKRERAAAQEQERAKAAAAAAATAAAAAVAAQQQQQQQQPAVKAEPVNGVAGAAAGGEPEAMDEDLPASGRVEVTNVETLTGHDNEVFICAWSPTQLLLASG